MEWCTQLAAAPEPYSPFQGRTKRGEDRETAHLLPTPAHTFGGQSGLTGWLGVSHQGFMRCYSELQSSNLPHPIPASGARTNCSEARRNPILFPLPDRVTQQAPCCRMYQAQETHWPQRREACCCTGRQIRTVSRQPAVDAIGWPTECIQLANSIVPSQFHYLSRSTWLKESVRLEERDSDGQ